MGGESGGHMSNTMPDERGAFVPIEQLANKVADYFPTCRRDALRAELATVEQIDWLQEICSQEQITSPEVCAKAVKVIKGSSEDALNRILAELQSQGSFDPEDHTSCSNVVVKLIAELLLRCACAQHIG